MRANLKKARKAAGMTQQQIITTQMRYVNLNPGGKNRTIRVAESDFLNYCRSRAVQGVEAPAPRRGRRPKTGTARIPTWEEAQAMYGG